MEKKFEMVKIFVNLVPLNGEEFGNEEIVFNLVQLNGEGFQNDENICQSCPARRRRILN